VIVAKVNGKELPGKPTIKWFKGKWQELGSKSGARFSFKESHDSASNVSTRGRLAGEEGRGRVARRGSSGRASQKVSSLRDTVVRVP
jgi:hypothetical protein